MKELPVFKVTVVFGDNSENARNYRGVREAKAAVKRALRSPISISYVKCVDAQGKDVDFFS